MKKFLLSSALLIMVAFYGYSQSISLSTPTASIAPNATIIQPGTPDSSELITYLYVKNTSSNLINVYCKKVELTMLPTTEMTMCWAGNCYPPAICLSPNAQPIAAGQTITDFVGHYTQSEFLHFTPGESVIRWVFYDAANLNDSASVTIKYTTYPLGVEDQGIRQSALSNVYPNPAGEVAGCSYTLPAGAVNTFIVRDILGSTVYTQDLQSGSGRVSVNTANLRDGVYFCSLLVDGKVSQTKKLIVQH